MLVTTKSNKMFAKAAVILFVLYTVQTIHGGSFKYSLLAKQPLQVQELINSLQYETNNVYGQFELAEMKLKTAVSVAILNTKINQKAFQNYAKTIKDATCGPLARLSIKTVNAHLVELKKCNAKDDIRAPRAQIVEYLRTLQTQAFAISGYCNVMSTDEAAIDECVNNGVHQIEEQLDTVRATVKAIFDKASTEGSSCVNDVVSDFNAAIEEATNIIEYCLHPTVATVVIETTEPATENENNGEITSEQKGDDQTENASEQGETANNEGEQNDDATVGRVSDEVTDAAQPEEEGNDDKGNDNESGSNGETTEDNEQSAGNNGEQQSGNDETQSAGNNDEQSAGNNDEQSAGNDSEVSEQSAGNDSEVSEHSAGDVSVDGQESPESVATSEDVAENAEEPAEHNEEAVPEEETATDDETV